MLEFLKGMDIVNLLIAIVGAVGTFIIIYCTIYLVFVRPRKKVKSEAPKTEEKKDTENGTFKPNLKGYNNCDLNDIMGYDFIQILSSDNKEKEDSENSSEQSEGAGRSAEDKPKSFASSTGVGMTEGINESTMGVTGKDKDNDDSEEPEQPKPVTHSAAPPRSEEEFAESLKDDYVQQPHMTDAISSEGDKEEDTEYVEDVQYETLTEEEFAAFSRFGSDDSQSGWDTAYENCFESLIRQTSGGQQTESGTTKEDEDDGSGDPSERRLEELAAASFYITDENREKFQDEEREFARLVDSKNSEDEKELLNSLNEQKPANAETVQNVEFVRSEAKPIVETFEFEIESER